jgi:hypothetical protein
VLKALEIILTTLASEERVLIVLHLRLERRCTYIIASYFGDFPVPKENLGPIHKAFLGVACA